MMTSRYDYVTSGITAGMRGIRSSVREISSSGHCSKTGKKYRIPADENTRRSVFWWKYGYSIDRQIGYQLGSVRFHFQAIEQSLIAIEYCAHDITDSFAAH